MVEAGIRALSRHRQTPAGLQLHTSFVTGGYFYYGPDNFLTSRSYPAGYVCAVGGYLCEGDSFVHDTGTAFRKISYVSSVLRYKNADAGK